MTTRRRRDQGDFLHLHVQIRAQEMVDLTALSRARGVTRGAQVGILIRREVARLEKLAQQRSTDELPAAG